MLHKLAEIKGPIGNHLTNGQVLSERGGRSSEAGFGKYGSSRRAGKVEGGRLSRREELQLFAALTPA
jgi:hypothetical protein